MMISYSKAHTSGRRHHWTNGFLKNDNFEDRACGSKAALVLGVECASGKVCSCQYLSDDGREGGGGGQGRACLVLGLLELTGDEHTYSMFLSRVFKEFHKAMIPWHPHPGILEFCLASLFLPRHSSCQFYLLGSLGIWVLFIILAAVPVRALLPRLVNGQSRLIHIRPPDSAAVLSLLPPEFMQLWLPDISKINFKYLPRIYWPWLILPTLFYFFTLQWSTVLTIYCTHDAFA